MKFNPEDKTREAIERQAAAWIVKLNAGKLSRDDASELEDWLNEAELHRGVFTELGSIWLDSCEIESALAGARDEEISVPRVVSSWTKANPARFAWAIAASLCLVLTAIVALYTVDRLGEPARVNHFAASTRIGENRLVTLSDGSTVQLNTDSEVEIFYSARERRIVLARGEARFDVAHDTRRPFRVYAGDKLIEAVGTSFDVQLVGASVDVFVTEGVVKLAHALKALNDRRAEKESGKTIALLEAGRNAVLDESQVLISEMSDIEIEKRVAWTKRRLFFDGETLDEVISQFNRYTNDTIVIADENIREMRITGYVNSEDTVKFLNALEASFGVEQERRDDGKIYLSGKETKE